MSKELRELKKIKREIKRAKPIRETTTAGNGFIKFVLLLGLITIIGSGVGIAYLMS